MRDPDAANRRVIAAESMTLAHTLSMNHETESSAEATRTTEATRITVALIPKAAADLGRLQERTRLSKTDITNRAVSLYEFIDAEISAGSDLLVRAPDGTVQAVKLL